MVHVTRRTKPAANSFGGGPALAVNPRLLDRGTHRAVTASAQDVRWWCLVDIEFGWGEANMAGKDKGGRSTKTPAAKTAKEKRQAKRDKRDKKSSKDGLLP